MKIAIYGNKYQEAYLNELGSFFISLAKQDISIAIESTFYNYLCRVLKNAPKTDFTISGRKFEADIALSIGGDGTFLHTAQWVGDKQIPILGINTGHLGYLADVKINEATHIIEDLLNGNFKIENREMIEVMCDKYDIDSWKYALNEVAILKQDTASMITVDTHINGAKLADYQGDGLIISTPTGSTGYNLSVGGPIIEPTAKNWVVSPIAAHSLTMRPLVISNDCEIEITTHSRAQNYCISIDGHSTSLPVGSTIKIRKAPFVTKVIQRKEHNFTDTLRDKLLWGVNKRQ